MYVLPNVNYGRNLEEFVTENFQYWEFVSSMNAVRLGIANVPNEQEWKNIEFLAKNVVQPIRDAIGKPLTINSGFRCKKLNDAAGSTDTSFHRLGCAVDLDSENIPLMKILEIAHGLPAYSEIIAEYFPQGWVHVAYKEGDNRKMLKLKDPKHHFARVTIDTLRKLYGAKS